MALESRLTSPCFTRTRSALTSQVLSKGRKLIWMSRCCACNSVMDWHSRRISISDTGSCDSVSLPDSITARSRIWLISSSRYHPALVISCILISCVAVGGGVLASSNCEKPRMALSGVRSSWLMLERKSDLARLAFSAAHLAFSNWTLVVRSCSASFCASIVAVTRCAFACCNITICSSDASRRSSAT